MKTSSLEHYAGLFRNLRTGSVGGRARPHKPVMLLSVLTLAEAGRLTDGRIYYSPDLLEIFCRFFEVVRSGNDKLTPYYPFFYLRSAGFWRLHAKQGHEGLLELTDDIHGPGQLVEMVSHAGLDDRLLALIADTKAREILRLTLIERYFPAQRAAVLRLCGEENAIGRRERYDEGGMSSPAEAVAESVRDTAFGRVVRRAYDYRCAMCGLRFVLDDVILVDAAHLIPFAESHDDSPPNGIAICKNHHWLMDRYLIAPSAARGKDYSKPVWAISPLLDDRIESHRECADYKGRTVILPREERHYPSPKALAWRTDRLRS